jgi:hypothetical protein
MQLAQLTLAVPAIVPFVNGLAWVSLVTAGHTKRITTNALVLIGYAIGNGAATFIWKAKYQPRYIRIRVLSCHVRSFCLPEITSRGPLSLWDRLFRPYCSSQFASYWQERTGDGTTPVVNPPDETFTWQMGKRARSALMTLSWTSPINVL